jgi:hypothetical protein
VIVGLASVVAITAAIIGVGAAAGLWAGMWVGHGGKDKAPPEPPSSEPFPSELDGIEVPRALPPATIPLS